MQATLGRRLRELELADLGAYRAYLEAHPGEWRVLDRLCRVTISRFYRDRAVFACLEQEVLPPLARSAAVAGRDLAAWSAGCGSGEEPYTLALLWNLALAPEYPHLELTILATDLDPILLERARTACYELGSLCELPEDWRRRGFMRQDDTYCLRREFQRWVTLVEHDVREQSPGGPFDLVLCRNLAFTYFERGLQEEVCATVAGCLRPGGAFVLGTHESLPAGAACFLPWPGARAVYRRRDSAFADRRHIGDRLCGGGDSAAPRQPIPWR